MQSFEEILDKMAFMFFEEPEDEDEPLSENFDYMTRIAFKGVISGILHVFFTHTSAEQFARNFVGIREEDKLFDGTINDAVSEFTNMVMGHTMTTLDPQHRFEMEVPQVVDEVDSPPEGMETIEILGGLDEEPIKLLLYYREDSL